MSSSALQERAVTHGKDNRDEGDLDTVLKKKENRLNEIRVQKHVTVAQVTFSNATEASRRTSPTLMNWLVSIRRSARREASRSMS